MTRQIHFNAFDMNCVGHQSPGLWRHPRDQSHRYNDLAYWTAAIWVLAGAVASELDAAHTRGARI